MVYLLSILFSLFILNISLFGQTASVKELDQKFIKENKHKLTRVKAGKKDEILSVYVFKTDKRIFSIMKREMYKSNKKLDSSIAYQFGYINDTLLRVWFVKSDPINKMSGMIIAYISEDKIIAIKKTGNIYLPNMSQLKEKSEQLTIMAKELLSKLK